MLIQGGRILLHGSVSFISFLVCQRAWLRTCMPAEWRMTYKAKVWRLFLAYISELYLNTLYNDCFLVPSRNYVRMSFVCFTLSKLGAYRPDFSLTKYDLVVFFIEKMIMFNSDLWFILFYFILFPSTRCICVSSNSTLNSCYFNIQLYIEQMVKIFLKRYSTIILKLRVSLFWI